MTLNVANGVCHETRFNPPLPAPPPNIYIYIYPGKVDAVAVGADRVAANGDTANKIGTLQLAIAAKHYDLPFLVVAPVTTCDPKVT